MGINKNESSRWQRLALPLCYLGLDVVGNRP